MRQLKHRLGLFWEVHRHNISTNYSKKATVSPRNGRFFLESYRLLLIGETQGTQGYKREFLTSPLSRSRQLQKQQGDEDARAAG